MGGRSRALKPEAPADVAPEAPGPTEAAVEFVVATVAASLADHLAALAHDLSVQIAYDGTTITVTSPAGAFTHPDAGAFDDPAAFAATLRHRIRKLLSPRKPL